MTIWLKYLAVVVLVGNGLNAFWGFAVLGRMILLGSLATGLDRLALNLGLSIAAIALAASIAAPARRAVSLTTKMVAVPSILVGGLGITSSAIGLYTLATQPFVGLPTDRLAMEVFLTERAVQNAFFAACTLALAILVLAGRRDSGAWTPSP